MAHAIRGMGKRYTSSGRGMLNLFEIVINAINKTCQMPEGLLRKSGAGSSLVIINTVC
jgi:hypothetical protein